MIQRSKTAQGVENASVFGKLFDGASCTPATITALLGDVSGAAELGLAPSQPKVAILLCTYNGQPYLIEQLESYATQTHSNWQVWASDDGSHDGTWKLLEAYSIKWGGGSLFVRSGPRKGFAANFLSLICDTGIEAEYFAFSDQDDVWSPYKLERAVAWLESIPDYVPALYCSRTILVDHDNKEIGLSPLFTRAPSFNNALVQNIGGGNTMVLNSAARQLLVEVGADLSVISHDWWTYMLVTGCGGQVFYDEHPSIRYRQHDENLIGTNRGLVPRMLRFKKLLHGRFKGWIDVNLDNLVVLRAKFTEENRAIFDEFRLARKKWLIPRVWGIRKSGVVRQSLIGNVGLLIAAIFNKI